MSPSRAVLIVLVALVSVTAMADVSKRVDWLSAQGQCAFVYPGDLSLDAPQKPDANFGIGCISETHDYVILWDDPEDVAKIESYGIYVGTQRDTMARIKVVQSWETSTKFYIDHIEFPFYLSIVPNGLDGKARQIKQVFEVGF